MSPHRTQGPLQILQTRRVELVLRQSWGATELNKVSLLRAPSLLWMSNVPAQAPRANVRDETSKHSSPAVACSGWFGGPSRDYDPSRACMT